MRNSLLATLLLAASLLSACSDVPVVDLRSSFSIQVFDSRDNKQPAKIDFLWVIDNSSSMCEEQLTLSKSFDSFIKNLQESFDLDVRMAVVNTNVLGDRSGFNVDCAERFPVPCRRQMIKKCLRDEDCLKPSSESGKLPDPIAGATWQCTWEGKAAAKMTNKNGSINSRCMLECPGDESCRDMFGQEFTCVSFPGGIAASGCMSLPDCSNCEGTPPILEARGSVSNLDRFRCIATVGADPAFQANLEQGLNAARYALDGNGPNAAQAKLFLRPDAWLVLIFVSDEDDCSLAKSCLLESDGLTWRKDTRNCIMLEQYNRCAMLADSNGGGPLEPVGRLVNFFKGLKSDPSKVLVAAVVGDSQKTSAADKQKDVEDYRASEAAPGQFSTNSYICSSDLGVADYGARYFRFVQAFGPNGVAANICGPAACSLPDGTAGFVGSDGSCNALAAGEDPATLGIGGALSLIGETIVKRVVRICLPQPVRCLEKDSENRCLKSSGVDVIRITAGTERITLAEAPPSAVTPGPGEFRIEEDRSCGGTLQAVFFGDVLSQGDRVEVRYEADPSLGVIATPR